ncbi:unnamed protein product [Rhizophagus irregularis]|nr:unnamed protein product [Rhizophagus irregularis]
MTSVKEWIEEKIKNGYIRYFDYDQCNQISIIGRGRFGIVSKANLANTGLVALKTICSENSEEEHSEFNDEFVKELKLLREVDSHPNINRFLGITKDSEYYILRLALKKYIDGNREKPIEGTLPKYQRLYEICWDDKPKSRPDIEEVYEIISKLDTFDLQFPQPNIHNIDDKSKENDHDDLSISSNYSSPIDTVNSYNNDDNNDNIKKFEGIFKSLDYDLDKDERKLKYKDYNIILCEKCNEKFNRDWYCRKCYINETEEEKYPEGGFAEVRSATWTNGRIEKWDHGSNIWERSGSFKIALKILKNSRDLSEEFLNELKFLKSV